MASVEYDQSLDDSVLLKLNYRDLQQVAKRFKIPANLKKDVMIMLIQSRRDGKEKPIDEFFTERNELKAKRLAEKQEIMLNGPDNLHIIQPKLWRGRGRGRGGLQLSLHQVHKNLQMTSHRRPMYPNMQPMPRLQRAVIPKLQYQQETINPQYYSSFHHHFNSQHPSLNISDVHGNSYERGVNIGQREQYYNQLKANDFSNGEVITQNSCSDEEIDVGVEDLNCVSSNNDIGNDDKQETDDMVQETLGADQRVGVYLPSFSSTFPRPKMQMNGDQLKIKEELDTDLLKCTDYLGILNNNLLEKMHQEQSTDNPIFETQQNLTARPADMNVSYQQQSCMLSSTLYQQQTVMQTSQSAIVPKKINKLPIFCGNNRNNFTETTCQQNVVNFSQLQPMTSPTRSTSNSGLDSEIDSPVINMLDKLLEWQNTMSQPTTIDLNFEANISRFPMVTNIEKKKCSEVANDISCDKCQTSANYMGMVTNEVQSIMNINSNPPRTYMYSETLQLSGHVNDQGMLRQRLSSRNSDTSSIPEVLIENAKENLDNYTEVTKKEEEEKEEEKKDDEEEMFPCTNSIRGCTKRLYIFQFDDHVKYCHHQIIHCFFGCGWMDILKVVPDHLSLAHPWSIEKCADKFTIMTKEMFLKNPQLCYIQSYNERIFLITLNYFQGHLYTSIKFLPDGNATLSFGGIEILYDETADSKEIPFSPLKWSGVLEPYHPHLSPTHPDPHSLIVNINTLQDSFKVYTNVNKLPEPNDYVGFDQFRNRDELF